MTNNNKYDVNTRDSQESGCSGGESRAYPGGVCKEYISHTGKFYVKWLRRIRQLQHER